MPRHQLAALRAVRIGTLNGLVHWMLPQSLQGGSATGLSVTGALGRAVAGDAPMVRQPELSVDPQRPPLTHSASRWAQVNRSRKYAYGTATLCRCDDQFLWDRPLGPRYSAGGSALSSTWTKPQWRLCLPRRRLLCVRTASWSCFWSGPSWKSRGATCTPLNAPSAIIWKPEALRFCRPRRQWIGTVSNRQSGRKIKS